MQYRDFLFLNSKFWASASVDGQEEVLISFFNDFVFNFYKILKEESWLINSRQQEILFGILSSQRKFLRVLVGISEIKQIEKSLGEVFK